MHQVLFEQFVNSFPSAPINEFRVARIQILQKRARKAGRQAAKFLAISAMADDAVCGAENSVRAPIILFEFNNGRMMKMLFEFEDIGDLRCTPSVDALIVVSDYANVSMDPSEFSNQLHLQLIRVLKFIHHDELESSFPSSQNIRKLLQEAHGKK